MKANFAATVDRGHEGAPLAVEGDVHPGRRMRHVGIERRRAQVDRDHPAAHEIACDRSLAAMTDSQLLAHGAAWSVRADEVGSVHRVAPAVGDAFELRLDRLVLVVEAQQAPAEMQRDRRVLFRMAAQGRLDEPLRDPMRQLGGAPTAGRLADQARRLARRRQAEARQFVAREAGEVRDVGREVGRQSERSDLVGEAEAPEVLHRARLRRIGLRRDGGAGLVVDQQGRDAAQAELVAEHQPARSAADDDHGDALGQGGLARIASGHRRIAGSPPRRSLQQRFRNERASAAIA
jgi:hypothetical protein